MKILHVVNISFVLPNFIGEQFDHFIAKGMKIYVACTPSSHFDSYSQEKGFVPVRVNILREINIFADLKAIFALRKVIIEQKIDIVIGHTPKGAMIAMIASFLANNSKRIYFRHGLMYETSTGLRRFLLKSVEKLTGQLASKVVCVSRSIVEKSEEDHLNDPEKNLLLNEGSCNGVNLTKFSVKNINRQSTINLNTLFEINENDKVVGYVGRLVKDKGIEELLSAWRILERTRSDIKLLLVGPFEDRDSIEDDDKAYVDNSKSIIHAGLQYDVSCFYSLMDVFILPSYREGFGQVILEASAMQLPIITTRSTGCINAILEGKTGIYCDINPEDIARKIEFYLDNPSLAKAHGENGRLFVERNYDQEIIWEEIEEKVLEIEK